MAKLLDSGRVPTALVPERHARRCARLHAQPGTAADADEVVHEPSLSPICWRSDVSAALAGVCARCTGELSGYAINQTTVARSTSKRKKEEILARNSTYYWFYRSSLQVRLFRTHDFHLKAAG